MMPLELIGAMCCPTVRGGGQENYGLFPLFGPFFFNASRGLGQNDLDYAVRGSELGKT